MPDQVGSVLLLLCLLQIKHMFADFFLQTPKMLSGRCNYVHSGRAQHAGVHVLGTILVLLPFAPPISFILIVGALEWVVHFHIDFGKARYSDSRQLTPAMASFWRAMGMDQALHQLTYVAMVWAWLVFAVT